METAGWATLAVGFVASFVFVLNYVLGQVPMIAEQVVAAVKAIREARESLRKQETPEVPRQQDRDQE